jgi:hypothetical protein
MKQEKLLLAAERCGFSNSEGKKKQENIRKKKRNDEKLNVEGKGCNKYRNKNGRYATNRN